MKYATDTTQLNDPIYGFISIPNGVLFKLVEHPYFQRLRRISQMGMSYTVFPGAHHTRFLHAIGAMHLAQVTVQTLRKKKVFISDAEEEALCVAILLHDIGHGPFSHAMEHSIVENVNHENISLLFMEALNKEMEGALDLAIQIFKNEYYRPFFHQLIASQLDLDRLDYLRRDSFYTGASEGAINVQRLIAMWDVKDDHLVVESKGIYSVESFLVARRLMYWQVYFHKTGVVAEQLLGKMLKRAKELVSKGMELPASDALSFFLKESVSLENFSKDTLESFAALDDSDIITAMKAWIEVDDFILSTLSKKILNREFLKIVIEKSPIDKERFEEKKLKIQEEFQLTAKEVSYFVFTGQISNQAYSMDRSPIHLLTPEGEVVDVAHASDQLNLKMLSEKVQKYFLCYPKVK
ncbi:MAG TPA: HD domain-containing protein [Flavobacteriaceae bacterium]|nr:HD domain-containing protein [Flavobacteriaceae bacterium]